MPDNLHSIVGPYEHWVLGTAGRPHTGITYDKVVLLAGIGELPIGYIKGPADKPDEMRIPLPDEPMPQLGIPSKMYTPTLWTEGLNFLDADQSIFIPCIVRYSGTPASILLASRSDFINLTSEFLGNFFDLQRLNSPKAEHGYRLNSPLPAGTLNEHFTHQPPSLEPNAGLKIEIHSENPNPGKAQLVLMAVIDDGLPFAHQMFRDKEGSSRIECCWLQSAPAKEMDDRVLFGRELRRTDIDKLVSEHPGHEDEIYRTAQSLRQGTWSPLAQPVTHGSYVLDIAAGHLHHASPVAQERRPVAASGNLDRMRMICVELPPATVIDTVGFGKEFYYLSAFHYIIRQAEQIAAAYELKLQDVPLIINFSFGFSGGPHDGHDRLEEAIAQLVKTRNDKVGPTRLVMPSGNEFLSALYGEIRKASDSKIIPWRISPNDRTSNYLEIWYPARENTKENKQPQSVTLIAPDGTKTAITFPSISVSPEASAIQSVHDVISDGHVIGQISIDFYRSYRWRVMIILAPTEVRDASLAPARAGLWKVEVDTNTLEDDDVICCRIQRDNATHNPWQGGRQSYFDHPQDSRFDATGAPAQTDDNAIFVRRFGTLNGLATHDHVMVVAGYDRATGNPASYSSSGSTIPSPASPAFVHCAAPSDDSPVMRGQRARGSKACSVGRLIGTSAAAPFAARMMALEWLESKPEQIPTHKIPSSLEIRLGKRRL